ncbi:hypothetical protein G4V62_14935 [Bacillaceae bacterium SIJ1]|uniref:YheC/YheD family protein n=1 Tax=Litoribacterium kuwaitense TaxID=1398745 RepID=UPI0013EDF029|nr:YheC/YheD family protein [Litoribacterium kuwaitense]NGP46181.1 hypothetical protein [Litoribacterium kuwaitense]
MPLIGMLRKYKNPMMKDTVAAMFAKEHQAEAIFFNPAQIDFEKKLIFGQMYKFGEWVEEVTYFPDVIYNDIPLRQDEPIYRQLQQEGLPFTTHRLGKSKLEFQEQMKQNAFLSKYVIDTISFKDVEQLDMLLQEHRTVFLKPNRGHKGLGIFIFEKFQDEIHVSNASGLQSKIPHKELGQYVMNIKDIEYHHLQPGVNSVTREGNPFIIRSYVGRDGAGQWRLFFHYAAVSPSKNKIVNVSVGSSITYITQFLDQMYGENAKMIKLNLNKLAIETAKQTQSMVEPTVDALGIDFGINEHGDIYMIEINAFPGTRPFEALVESRAIPYTLFLAKQRMENK